MNQALQRPRAAVVGAGVVAAMAAAGLLFVGIGSFGLWTPNETQLATLALSAPGAAPLPALGLRLLGPGEAAARIPGAVVALLSLIAVVWAGAGLHNRRAGLLAAVALAGFPLFVLQARQLTTDLPACLGMALALGSLARGARVADGTPAFGLRKAGALGAFVVGLLIATWGAGVLGGALPLLGAAAVGFAVAEVPTAVRPRSWRLLAAVTGAGFVVAAVTLIAIRHTAGAPSWLLGGVPRGGPSTATFEAGLETLGFGLFPLAGLALFAFFAPPPLGRGNLSALLLLVTAALALFVGTVQLHLLGHAGMGLLAPCALVLGGWFDQKLGGDVDDVDRAADATADAPERRASVRGNPLLGFVAAVAALLLARDLTLVPEALVSSHLPARIAWPPGLTITPWVLGVGVASAVGLTALLQGPARGKRWWRLGAVGLVLGPPVVLAFVLGHVVVPALARHLSSRAQLDRFRQLAPTGASLALYRVGREETGVFDPPPALVVRDAAALIEQLGRTPDLFALVPRGELAALEAAGGEAGVPFVVADASSTRHLLLAGRLPAHAADQNPLRPFVQHRQSPPPTEKPTATWGNAIALLAAEFPSVVTRGRGLPVTLTFRVLARPAAGQKIFLHLERPGQPLLNGDHAPLAGDFPTDHWRPGDVIRDVHLVDLPRVTTPAGGYRVAVGFWPGGDTAQRLPITAGNNDGHDRAQLGSVQVQ